MYQTISCDICRSLILQPAERANGYRREDNAQIIPLKPDTCLTMLIVNL